MPNRIVDTVEVMDRDGKRVQHHIRFDSRLRRFNAKVNGVACVDADFVKVRDDVSELVKDRVDGTGAVKIFILVDEWRDEKVIAINTAAPEACERDRYAIVELRNGKVASVGKFEQRIQWCRSSRRREWPLLIPYTPANLMAVIQYRRQVRAIDQAEHKEAEALETKYAKQRKALDRKLKKLAEPRAPKKAKRKSRK